MFESTCVCPGGLFTYCAAVYGFTSARHLQGSARDLGAVRSHMQLAQPELDFLMSKINQERTSDGFQIMGHRLALEVAQYLQASHVHRQMYCSLWMSYSTRVYL